jgi:hypothetical protein
MAAAASISAAVVANANASCPCPTTLFNLVGTTPHEPFNLHLCRSDKLLELRNKIFLERPSHKDMYDLDRVRKIELLLMFIDLDELRRIEMSLETEMLGDVTVSSSLSQ